ncbi:GD25401 [Drosophila simulans]|uniref:GD25401 n=1 Tax=Drosophila simulans TaxID=7240 RepID=B4QCB8_DROSI|nr:GD25401 [Drosophila simulans]
MTLTKCRRNGNQVPQLDCSCCALICDPYNALQSELIRILQVGSAVGPAAKSRRRQAKHIEIKSADVSECLENVGLLQQQQRQQHQRLQHPVQQQHCLHPGSLTIHGEQQLQQQHLAQLVTHKQLQPMLLHLPTKRDIIATYCLAGAAPPTLQPPPPREHQQHVVRSAAAATATAQLQQQLQQQQHEHL